MYVLDTNTLIYFFKGFGRVADRLLHTAPMEIGIPSIVLYELEVGLAKSNSPKKRRQQLEAFLAITTLLPFDRKQATCAANIRATLEKQGRSIGPYDILIAATALSCQGILVTHNTREFERIGALKIEDWY